MKNAQNNDSAHVFGLLTNRDVLGKMSGRTGVSCADPPLPKPAVQERMMDMIPDSAQTLSAQYQDPLIVNARLVNLAAEIDRKLAARRALRPARSAAAKRGWEART